MIFFALDLLQDLEDDDEEIVFSDEEEEEEDDKKKSRNNKKKNKSVFAPAEEFAQLLEDEADAIGKPGSLNTLSNKDKSRKFELKLFRKIKFFRECPAFSLTGLIICKLNQCSLIKHSIFLG